MNKRDVYQEVTDRIVAALEGGTVPWRKPWSSTEQWPVSLDGRNYRGINIFLLGLMNYDDPRWGTYNAVKRHGGQVRRGEKATRVILWKPVPRKGEPGDKDGRDAYILLRDYAVFNAQQCDGLSELERPEEREHTPLEAAEALVVGYGNRPPIHHGKAFACYMPLTDRIEMPDAKVFESGATYYSTLFHELTHSTGHESRLKRLETATFGTDKYAKEELVAEMGAAMMCGLAGIDNLDQSAAYVDGWLDRLKQDRKLVISAAAQAQKACDHMVGKTWEDEKATEKEEVVAA